MVFVIFAKPRVKLELCVKAFSLLNLLVASPEISLLIFLL